MNISNTSGFNLINPIRPLSTMITQKSDSFNDALFNTKASTPITKKLNINIDRAMSDTLPMPKMPKEDFSFKASSQLVTQRFSEKDFSIFMPPSAIDVYKS